MYRRSPADWPRMGITSRSMLRVPPLEAMRRPSFRTALFSFFARDSASRRSTWQILASHFREAERRMAACGLQVRSDLSAELHDFHLVVHDNAPGNKAVRQNAFHFPIHVNSRSRAMGE